MKEIKKLFIDYTDNEVIKSLEKIIPAKEHQQFIKLIAPILCEEEVAVGYLFKLFAGCDLPEVIPNNTPVYVPMEQLTYYVTEEELTEVNNITENNKVLCTIKSFMGYHKISPYRVEFICGKDSDGVNEFKTTVVSEKYLEVFKEF